MTGPRPHVDRDRLLRLAVDAVERYSPSYAEEAATDVFEAALRDAGLAPVRQPVPPRPGRGSADPEARANLLVRVGPEPLGLLWVGHVDTVELAPEQQPGARVEAGVLHGLGAVDMKGACAAAVEALIAVAGSGAPLARGLALALVVGEEETGDGAETLVPTVRAPITVIGEPTGLAPCVEHFAYLELRLECGGNRSHAALPEVGDNAAFAMVDWITRIEGALARDLAPGRAAFNLREILGGSRHFVVAEKCEAHLDIHLAPEIERERVLDLVEAARAAAAERARGCSFRRDILSWAPGFASDPEAPALGPVREAFRSAGRDWAPQAFRSHSDANLFHPQGTLPVVLGPGDLALAHTRDERIALDELCDAASLYAAILLAAAC